MKKVIYVSGPYRNDNINGIFENIMRARNVAVRLWQKGYIVICPHLNSFLMDGVCGESVWQEGDLEILRRCDGIFMMLGWERSEGSKVEHALAYKMLKLIIYEQE